MAVHVGGETQGKPVIFIEGGIHARLEIMISLILNLPKNVEKYPFPSHVKIKFILHTTPGSGSVQLR